MCKDANNKISLKDMKVSKQVIKLWFISILFIYLMSIPNESEAVIGPALIGVVTVIAIAALYAAVADEIGIYDKGIFKMFQFVFTFMIAAILIASAINTGAMALTFTFKCLLSVLGILSVSYLLMSVGVGAFLCSAWCIADINHFDK